MKGNRIIPVLMLVLSLFLLFTACKEGPSVKVLTPTIRGSVSVPRNSGLSGSDFYVRVMEGDRSVYTGKANDDGSFSVAGLKEETTYRILVTTSEPGNLSDGTRDLSDSESEQTETSGYGGWLSNVIASIDEQSNVGQVSVKPLGTIKGNVSKTGAEDGYDVMVYIPGTSYMAMTDEEGNFSIFNVPQETYTIRFISNGYMPKMLDEIVLYSANDYENPVTTVSSQVLIKNSGTLIGTVSKIGSEDHSNVIVILSDWEHTYTGSSAEDGSLLISGIIPGTYSATISSSGFITQTVEAITIEAAKNTIINPINLIANGGCIKGSVKMNDSEEKTGVLITSRSSDGKYSYTTSTDNDGNFRISNAFPGTYTLTLSKTGYAIVAMADVLSIAGQETDAGILELSSDYGSVEGYVVDKNGTGIENAIVKVGEISIFTDEEGGFSKTGIPVGNHVVSISKEGFTTWSLVQTITIESSKTTNLGTIKLASIYGSVSGQVIVNDSGSVSGIHVSAVSSDGKNSYSTLTDSDGKYAFANMAKGSYSLTAKQSGYSDSTEYVTVAADNDTSVPTMTLVSKYGSVSGKVTLEDNADSSGVTITLTFSADPSIVKTTVSGADGTYIINNITKAGQYSVTLSKDGYVSNKNNMVSVELGQNQVVNDVSLKSLTSKVLGIARLAETEDCTGISILLKSKDNSVQYDATTDQQGRYVMARVNPGEYTLIVSKAGYISKTVESIVVESSTEKELDVVSLYVGVRSVTGIVKAELLTDHSGSLITATNLSDKEKVYSAISNSSGAYTLAGLVPGEYMIVISHTGYRTLTLSTVDVIEGSTKTIDTVEIEINRGTISGVATLEGRTNSDGIRIELLQGSTVVEAKDTNEAGEYSFYVPQGNYSGIRMTMTDFRTETVSKSIALFADNFVSIDNIELKATANTVYGTADVLTTDDDSNVTVSFDGHEEIPALVTEEDGSFRFDHIPLGNYTIRFQRDNCSDILVPVSVGPSDGIDLNSIVLTPNTASITGKVNLENGSSLAGVLVSVDMGTKTITGYTDASGRYEVGGISVADTYAVTYSKDGWQSGTQHISPKLERIEVREMEEITLVDVTAPVLNSVVINNGANTASDRNVILHFFADESGSGVSKVFISYDEVFDEMTPRYGYMPNLDYELPSGNGEKVIYVKVMDASGNLSNTVSASVTLTDQKKVVFGVLSGDDLHWTEEMSPYLVAGNILIEEDKTLTIDAGVDVQFAGAYYIQVEGILSAMGTSEKNISFYGVDDGVDAWQGINGVADRDSLISYASIEGVAGGLMGYLNISDSQIYASDKGSALNGYHGTIKRSSVYGRVNASNAEFRYSELTVPDSGSITNSLLCVNTMSGDYLSLSDSTLDNNVISSMSLLFNNISSINSTFTNCSLGIKSGMIYKCELNGCTFSSFSYCSIIDSNIIDCGKITTATNRTDIEQISLKGNYWGINNTAELNAVGENANLSFIGDYYDDFNITRMVLSGYKTEAIADAGYKLIEPTVSEYSIGDVGPAGGIVFYDKGYYSDGWRYLEASPSDIGDYRGYIFGYYKKSDNGNIIRSGTAYGIGFGKINTEILVGDMGEAAYTTKDGKTKTENYAARLCDILTYTFNGVIYDDWFLPSIDELNLMYVNLRKAGCTYYITDSYLSSSEKQGLDAGQARYRNFFEYFVEQGNTSRDDELRRVRAVRSF